MEDFNSRVFGLVRPYNDIHSLGVATVGKLLEDCGLRVVYGDQNVAKALVQITNSDNMSFLLNWIKQNKINNVGFSYRLDPNDAVLAFGKLYDLLKDNKQFKEDGGTIDNIYFAGLPEACKKVGSKFNERVKVFMGDENQFETLKKIGVPDQFIPKSISEGSKYDDFRIEFAKSIIASQGYKYIKPKAVHPYPEYGTKKDSLAKRIQMNQTLNDIPLFRAHVGPYNADYKQAKQDFNDWLVKLKTAGFLDIVSIGSSQLSQSHFGEDWKDMANGGGVPINSKADLDAIWRVSRPMLLRAYSGTKNVIEVAQVLEETINISWHALSIWWFNIIDGRGPNSVRESLKAHFETLHYIKKTKKPFEANVSHHFSFRGGDDVTYVLSVYLAALAAKKIGINQFVLQIMLNTPKYTWGVQDLAKARAIVNLVRALENDDFKIFVQPRAGLDYFSPDLDKAKIQLAAVTAMMDDIEPDNPKSPDIIHVVSYSEAVHLADPPIINESAQITTYALSEYRTHKRETGGLPKGFEEDVMTRTEIMVKDVLAIREILENEISNLYSPEGFYQVFKLGVFVTPYLWECREEFKEAVHVKTGVVNGGVAILDDDGFVVNPVERIKKIFSAK
jgi:hypothetical protein